MGEFADDCEAVFLVKVGDWARQLQANRHVFLFERSVPTDATKALVASGFVDAHRAAIVGTSFWGYLAPFGMASEPGLYRCAASISETVDRGKETQEHKFDQFSDPWYARAHLKLGDPKMEPEKFDKIAPLRRAEQVRAAVFISASEYDPSYRTSEAKELLSILERNQVPTESVSFLAEAGGVRRLRQQSGTLFTPRSLPREVSHACGQRCRAGGNTLTPVGATAPSPARRPRAI